MVEWQVCDNQFNGSTMAFFHGRGNNYKTTHCQIMHNKECFPKHYLLGDHSKTCGWEIPIGQLKQKSI